MLRSGRKGEAEEICADIEAREKSGMYVSQKPRE